MGNPTLQLKVTNPKTGEEKSFSISDERARVGRSSRNEVQLDDASVAQEHAVFRIAADGVWLTNLTNEGTTATSAGSMALGDAIRIANNAKVQVGGYVLECSLIVPTADFGVLIDASRLELPQLLTLPTSWRPGSVTVGGVPAALTERTWMLLLRMARKPRETLGVVELAAGIAGDSDGVDVSRLIRTLRKQLGAALEDDAAHERISMSVNSEGDDRKATVAVLIESIRGKGYRLNLAPGLIRFD